METTRRAFVRGITGAAVTGGLLCLENKNARAMKAPSNGEKLVATCGLYCGSCPMFLDSQAGNDRKTKEFMQYMGTNLPEIERKDFQCDGCLGKGKIIPFCAKCNIRACAEGKKIAYCSECSEFPCARISDFNNNHGKLLHHSEVLANLRHLKEMGIKPWAKSEEERWRCPQCQNRLSWYDQACSKCGAKRSGRLFPLTQA
jgi:hypothetical protein